MEQLNRTNCLLTIQQSDEANLQPLRKYEKQMKILS
jgi:hypothetical protein